MFVLNFSFWIETSFFDTETFTQVTVESLSEDRNRDAIAAEVTNQLLQDFPQIRDLVGERTVAIISNALKSDLANKSLANAADRAHRYVTSTSQEKIELDLRPAKLIIEKANLVLELLNREENIDLGSIPDSVVLVEANTLPTLGWIAKFNSTVIVLVFIFLIAIVAVFLLLKVRLVEIVNIYGKIFLSVSLIGLILSKLSKSRILNRLDSDNMRVVVSDIYSVFINRLNFQLFLIGIVGFMLIVTSTGWTKYVSNRATQIGKESI